MDKINKINSIMDEINKIMFEMKKLKKWRNA